MGSTTATIHKGEIFWDREQAWVGIACDEQGAHEEPDTLRKQMHQRSSSEEPQSLSLQQGTEGQES